MRGIQKVVTQPCLAAAEGAVDSWKEAGVRHDSDEQGDAGMLRRRLRVSS